MLASEVRLRARIAATLRDNAQEVTARWVEILQERLDVDPRGVLPSDSLLNHIPTTLQRIADFVADPEAGFSRELVQSEMGRLAHLRRSQGFGVNEVLAEYEILTTLLQSLIEDAVAGLDDPIDPVELVSVVGRFKDAIALLGVETARSYRMWMARERRERALQTTSFAQMLRHELRNQLGSAQTAGELLAEDGIDAERRVRLAKLVVRSLDRALETIDVVRAIVSDDLPTGEEHIWLPLIDVVQNVRRQSTLGEFRPTLDLNLDAANVPDVRVSAARVSMIVLNLLDNAYKYHDPEKQDHQVGLDIEELEADEDGQRRVRIVVSDNGRGIDPSLHDAVFEFSVRGDDAEDGSGLGLALSRDVVRQLGGSIELESEPGIGTRVSIVVPVRAADSDEVSDESQT
ncbi:MAG: ATP-binding protein [Gemmatimonadota bacterium]